MARIAVRGFGISHFFHNLFRKRYHRTSGSSQSGVISSSIAVLVLGIVAIGALAGSVAIKNGAFDKLLGRAAGLKDCTDPEFDIHSTVPSPQDQ